MNKYYDEAMRLHFKNHCTGEQISKILPVGKRTVLRWIAIFVSENGNKYPSPAKMKKKNVKDELQESDELTRLRAENACLHDQLKYERMRAEAFDMMIDIAERRFNIPIRKKPDAKQ